MASDLNDNDAQELFQEVDKDNDGFITFEEFTAFLKRIVGDDAVDGALDKIQEDFNAVDTDKDGKLNLKEVKEAFKRGDKFA